MLPALVPGGMELLVLALLAASALAAVYVPLKVFEGLKTFDEARKDS